MAATMSSPRQLSIEPLSDDDASSPLSDVENDEADLDGDPEPTFAPSNHAPSAYNAAPDDSSDDELSEANDTEAETERIDQTPQAQSRHGHSNQFTDTQEVTPSKLRQSDTVGAQQALNADRQNNEDEDDDELSDAQISPTSSPPDVDRKLAQSPPTLDILAAAAASREADSRKRKRSAAVANEGDEPPRKRSGSPATGDADDDVEMGDDQEPDASTNTQSGEQSGDEAPQIPALEEEQDELGDDADAEAQLAEEVRSRKQTRSASNKRKSPRGGAPEEDGEPEGATAEGQGNEEDGGHTGDEDLMDADLEEAEVAHKNEEELERKRAAFDQLTVIEKRFATFRDRLYEERIEQLNREEAMLRADNPVHPEYLAMLQCIDSRRDERVRAADLELELNLECLGRTTIAKRSMAHSQFYQDIREKREESLAELGQHWFHIQHERRKNANSVPEYSLVFPKTETDRTRNAIAYNKEVSILSGVAKYEGMPAAPDMRGASSQEMDDDFEAMGRGRQSSQRRAPSSRPIYREFGGLPFGSGLDAAGEEFVSQTPWLNPSHPDNAHIPHPLQRQHQLQNEPRKRSPLPGAPNRRHSNQPNPAPSGANTGTAPQPGTAPPVHAANGNPPARKGTPRQTTSSPELSRATSLLDQVASRARKSAVPAEQGPPVKRESLLPVGGP